MPQQKVLLKKESKFSRGFTRKNVDFIDISSLIGFIGFIGFIGVNLR
jgi:hypothetical protein